MRFRVGVINGVDLITWIPEGDRKRMTIQLMAYPEGQGKKRNHRL